MFTVSIHKFRPDFFPGTGKWSDDGHSHGKHFCLNIPLSDGIDDESYTTLFREVIDATITSFKPSAIVLQCGADSLGCDKLGAFNLSIAAHGDCVRFVKNFNLPLLVLGGGGYTIHNVSRCWTYETSVLLGLQIPNELPRGPFFSYFYPDFTLHPQIVQKVDNENSPAVLRGMISGVKQKLRYLHGAPSVSMEEFPPDLIQWLENDAKRAEEAERIEAEEADKTADRHLAPNEYFDGDRDNKGEGTGNGADGDHDSAGIKRGGPRRGAGRKPRGRGAGRVTFQDPGEAMEGVEEPGSAIAPTAPPQAAAGTARRGRGRGRGRGRPKKQASSSEPSDHMSE